MTAAILIPVNVPGGWARIEGEEPYPPHWRRCPSFAIYGVRSHAGAQNAQPWLTVEQMLTVCADGRYEMARQCDPHRLRRPEDILGPSVSGAYGRIPTALTAQEAELLCRLAGGTLADEIQARILCSLYRPLGMTVPAWTRSPWSDWSDHLIAYGMVEGMTQPRWFAAEDRCLPIDDPSGCRRVMIEAGTPFKRLSGWAGVSSAAGPDDRMLGAAWLVTNE
ncbi:hypothetical protein FZ983_27790 [Azospirillum sp. B21]|uniref:hypothetical protein n=1 Tax=Azospirillum sp. B21 TaxID=2607496 RepID=UPI0011EC4214|nr:hypothetical protein [Azospirillum sp. B21]KAA0574348.1 hypothetical protein FZ983_27790 [Azospirillum sp. B21]